MGGFVIHAYCMGGTDGALPNYGRFCYLELSQQARGIHDWYRFKYWCRLAWSGNTKPSESDPMMQLNWQRALTDKNIGYATTVKLEANTNIVETIMNDFSTLFKPNYLIYATSSNSVTSTIIGIPTDVTDGFQLRVYSSEGDNGVTKTTVKYAWKGKFHIELNGHDSSGKPLKYIGYLNYTSTTKPTTWPSIVWSKIMVDTVVDIR